MEIRIGSGYDIHCLVKNRRFILGNVAIPHNRGFLGHSDGDVLIHSLIDALLGAMNKGDIGMHFPDTSPEFKNIDSSILLEKTNKILSDAAFEIINIDSTVICERPKLRNHIDGMRVRLAEILGIDKSRISVKAKTKEGLDAAGKGKAVEAYTVCLIKMK